MHTDPQLSSAGRSKTSLSVHVYVTNACNLRCRHCYYDALMPEDCVNERRLAPEAIDDILRVLALKFDSDIHLEGGEPFLHPDLSSVLAGLPEDVLPSITVTTNGMVPFGLDLKLLNRLHMLRVSVEGHTDELQRRVRLIPLSRIVSNLGPLLADGLNVTLRITLFPHSAALAGEMLSTFLGQGFSRFSFFECQPVGRAGGGRDNVLSEEQLLRAIEQIATKASDDRIERLTFHLPKGRESLVMDECAPIGGLHLRALEQLPNLTVNSNGDLGSCPWRITSRRTEDQWGSYVPGRLAEQIHEALRAGQLQTRCDSLSSHVLTAHS